MEKSLKAVQSPDKNARLGDIYGSFFLGKMEIAIGVECIQEVVNYPGTMTEMPLAPDFLIGLFNLRGTIVPVINLKKLLKADHGENQTSGKVAILDCGGARIGFVFDSTGEILRPREEEITEFRYEKESERGLIRGALKLDQGARLLQILDANALISIENIPQILEYNKIHSTANLARNANHSSRRKCITFSACGIHMAFEISGIHEIVKAPEIQHLSFESDLCAGVMNLRGKIVSILNMAKLLKKEEAKDKDHANKRVIVLKLGNEFFGILVDSVDSINTYAVEGIIPIPVLIKDRAKAFQGCLVFGGLGEVILLNHEELLSGEEIHQITQGHSKLYQDETAEETKRSKSTGQRQVYISFRLGRLFGVPIQVVKEIINYPEEILSAPLMPAFVKGILNLRGNLVTIIDARTMYKIEQDKPHSTADSKVIVFQRGQEQFGLVVDTVESILTIDSHDKLKVPDLFLKGVDGDFHQDIHEIIQIPGEQEQKISLIVLNVDQIMERIQGS